MDNSGLSELDGDDIKTVSYFITFVKPGAETILQVERSEVIEGPTDGRSFSALKVAEFVNHLRHHGIPWPSAWKEQPGDGYSENGQPLTQIPEQDQKYIELNYRVVLRRSSAMSEGKQAMADALRKIRERLE
jgi:hypothetical protein